MAEQKDNSLPHPNDPVTPRDYDPTHDKELPHEQVDITGEKEGSDLGVQDYEEDTSDAEGRPVGMRRTGEFIVPNENNITGEGWTLPTRAGGGWDQALDTSLEEQIEEPESPGRTNIN